MAPCLSSATHSTSSPSWDSGKHLELSPSSCRVFRGLKNGRMQASSLTSQAQPRPAPQWADTARMPSTSSPLLSSLALRWHRGPFVPQAVLSASSFHQETENCNENQSNQRLCGRPGEGSALLY